MAFSHPCSRRYLVVGGASRRQGRMPLSGVCQVIPQNQIPGLLLLEIFSRAVDGCILIYASIYVLAHPHCSSDLFKYMFTVKEGTNRSKGLVWRNVYIKINSKKECNPNMSFRVVAVVHEQPNGRPRVGSLSSPLRC